MPSVLLAQANALHLPLKDQSVHMVCTSPPYWGLRDYQTGTWHGGDADCIHTPADTPERRGIATSTLSGGKTATGHYHEDYGQQCGHCGALRIDNQLGLEQMHDCNGAFTGAPCGSCFICHMRAVFADVWRVLRLEGTLWLNCGDSYANDAKWGGTTGGKHVRALHGAQIGRQKRQTGLKSKDLCGVPWRLALALQTDGWTLRSDIIWEKPSCMPESVKDRPTRSHEYVFMFSKQERYFYDAEALREPGQLRPFDPTSKTKRPNDTPWHENRYAPGASGYGVPDTGRNSRSVWRIPSEPFSGAHFACFPQTLAARCIKAGSSEAGCCGACGAPLRREVETQRLLDGLPFEATAFSRPDEPHRVPANGIGHTRYTTRTIVKDWERSCTCIADIVPCRILDPFCGSGTTLLAARALGRHGLGIDLSAHYLRDIARKRLGVAALARWEGRESESESPTYTDLPLFGAQP